MCCFHFEFPPDHNSIHVPIDTTNLRWKFPWWAFHLQFKLCSSVFQRDTSCVRTQVLENIQHWSFFSSSNDFSICHKTRCMIISGTFQHLKDNILLLCLAVGRKRVPLHSDFNQDRRQAARIELWFCQDTNLQFWNQFPKTRREISGKLCDKYPWFQFLRLRRRKD